MLQGKIGILANLQVLSLEEGDLRFTYENMGVQVSHIEVDPRHGAIVDWLK